MRLPFKPCPDEEGIKTKESCQDGEKNCALNLALMKKGLRLAVGPGLSTFGTLNLALMKKGLRRPFALYLDKPVYL